MSKFARFVAGASILVSCVGAFGIVGVVIFLIISALLSFMFILVSDYLRK